MDNSKCQKCQIFHCTKEQDNKCYRCYNNLSKLYTFYDDSKFKDRVYEYVKSYLPSEENIKLLKFACQKPEKEPILKYLLNEMIEEDKYLTSEIAKELLRDIGRDTLNKARLICPFILDSWNINKNNGFKHIEDCCFNKFYRLDMPQNLPFKQKFFPDRDMCQSNNYYYGQSANPEWGGYEI